MREIVVLDSAAQGGGNYTHLQAVTRDLCDTKRRRHAVGLWIHWVVGTITSGALLVLFRVVLILARALPGRNRNRSCARPTGPLRILLTGRVDSENWSRAHLMPLTEALCVSELLVVMDGTGQTGAKIRHFPVPSLVGWIKPRAIVRSLWALRVALRERPDAVMAYSFFPPGVFALLAGRFAKAAAIVQLAGGPVELESGGLVTERPFVPEFMRKRLVPLCQQLCAHFELIVVRGRKAEAYVKQHVIPRRVTIIPGSVDPHRFRLDEARRTIDLVFVGRIVPFKQPEHLCQVIKRVAQQRPCLRAVVAGRGPLLSEIRDWARAEKLEQNVDFVGHVANVAGLLRRARVFLLTSRSEGLSIALAEAMTAGVVPVVPDVGDLGELVVNGQTGWLVQPGDFDSYAARICELLEDESLWQRLSCNAQRCALQNNSLPNVVTRWEKCLAQLGQDLD